jgi:hypothetical protein
VKHGRTFAISLGLNLALVGAAVGLLQKSVSPKMPAPAATAAPETASPPPPGMQVHATIRQTNIL